MAKGIITGSIGSVLEAQHYSLPERRLLVELISGEDKSVTISEIDGIPVVDNNSYSVIDTSYIGLGRNTGEIIIKFSRTFGGLGQANITLYNLHPDVVNKFTQTSYLPRVPNRIKIYAAYKSVSGVEEDFNGLGEPIYEGFILWAAPVGITDIALNIEAMEDFPRLNYDISVSPDEGGNPESLTTFDLIKSLCDYIGMGYNDEAIKDSIRKTYEKPEGVDLKNYSFTGKVVDFINRELYRFNRMQFIIDSGILYLRPNSDDENSLLSSEPLPNDRFISARFVDNVGNAKDVKSYFETVMIGAPEVSYYGANIRVLFTKKIKAGDRFRLISRLYPKFNFVYEIINVNYDLQLRGQNFYMDLECIRSRNSK